MTRGCFMTTSAGGAGQRPAPLQLRSARPPQPLQQHPCLGSSAEKQKHNTRQRRSLLPCQHVPFFCRINASAKPGCERTHEASSCCRHVRRRGRQIETVLFHKYAEIFQIKPLPLLPFSSEDSF